MRLKDQDGTQHMFNDLSASVSSWDDGLYGGGPSASPGWRTGPVTVALRAPVPEEPLADEHPARPLEADAERGAQRARQEEKPADKPRRGWLRRHPLLAALGLIALIFVAAAGYLYWEYTGHFEYTDDAFIAARQFSA